MPNHFHWLVKVKNQLEIESSSKSHDTHSLVDLEKTGLNPSDKWIISDEATLPDLNKNIGVLLRSFTRAMNIRYQSKGSLFQQRTNSKNVNPGKTIRDNYALICFLYILQNPVRNKLTDNIANWEFSSYRDYAGLRNGNLCNIDLANSLFDLPSSQQEFQKFANQTLPEHFRDNIF
jgi:putative transposase